MGKIKNTTVAKTKKKEKRLCGWIPVSVVPVTGAYVPAASLEIKHANEQECGTIACRLQAVNMLVYRGA